MNENKFSGKSASYAASRPGYVTALREVFGRFSEGGCLTTRMVCRAYWGGYESILKKSTKSVDSTWKTRS